MKAFNLPMDCTAIEQELLPAQTGMLLDASKKKKKVKKSCKKAAIENLSLKQLLVVMSCSCQKFNTPNETVREQF